MATAPATVLLLTAVALIAGGCHSSTVPSDRPSPTTVAHATTRPLPPPTRAPTSTTAILPVHPQPSADAAATVFMEGWISGNRAQSQSVATKVAVDSLYASRYAGQPLNDRGCSVAFSPRVCTWGPYAGGSGNLYQVSVAQSGPRWYVTSVTVES